MPDELDDYEERVERGDAAEDELEAELELADADELARDEGDDTSFDRTRRAYSGVEDDDSDVDVEELADAGALLDDPEREARRDANE